MATRIISGVVGAVLMIAVLLYGGVVGVVALMAALAALAVYELLTVAGFGWEHRVPAMVVAAAAPPLLLWNAWAVVLLAGVYLLAIVVLSVARHERLSIDRAMLLWALSMYATAGFTAVAALRMSGEGGLYYVILTLVIPWLADTGAYFTGVLCGKHKLCPVISPKKTVEGLVGGMVISLVAAYAVAAIYVWWGSHTAYFHWLPLLAAAVVGAPLSVFGDLFASVIKRQFGAKDYGNIMPGHGGIMDRFDSVLPVAIFIWMLTQVTPIFS